jgi:hypothetical protein
VVLICIILDSNDTILDQIQCRYVLLVRHGHFLSVPYTEACAGCSKSILKNYGLVSAGKHRCTRSIRFGNRKMNSRGRGVDDGG